MVGRPLLAFDTSGSVGSVAVGSATRVLASRSMEVRQEHAARLVPVIAEVLEAAGVALDDLGGIVVGEGPGSFTGVRVAAATAKGMAHARALPLWAFPSLEAAAIADDTGTSRYVLFDARSDRVYGACYRVESNGVHEIVAPHGGTLGDVLRGDVAPATVFVGDGAHRHRDAIARAGFTVSRGGARPLAEALLLLRALHEATARPVDVLAWEPRYVRASSAEPGWTP